MRDPVKLTALRKRYYQKHKERIRSYQLAYYYAHTEERKARARAYNKANRAKINAYRRSKSKFRVEVRKVVERLKLKLANGTA